tara:strand:+ start:40 stop:1923 length:1884 start_codon:yes stop_codon:yes gene_type:complete
LLQNIRDRSTGWIAYVIVIGISIPFALWGIDQYFTSNNIIVAEINDTKISLERLNNEYQGKLQEMQSLISKDENEAELQKKIIKRTVLDELIDSVLVREFVNKNKFQISEKSLILDIKNNKMFHESNKFSPKRYQNLLQSQGIKISDYERIRRSELKTLQFYNNIVGSSFIASKQLKDLENLKYQKRNFKLLSLSYKDFVDNDKQSTEQQKKDFYVKYRNLFSMPEKFDIEYIVFNKNILKKQLSINLGNLENYYNENKFKYVITEKRKVSQIFLSNLKNNKEENANLIKLIAKKISSGEKFGELANKYSNDKLSNKKEGNIGWVSRNEITKKISDEIFNLKSVEEVSNIVETESGFYVLKLKGLRDAKIKKFNEVKELVKRDYENIQIVNKYDEIFEDLSNILFENPDSLNKVEEYLSVSKVSTGLLTLPRIKKDHKILNDQKILEVLASKSVNVERQNSALIEVKDNMIMLRINNKAPVEFMRYEEVKKEVESLINTESAIETMKDSIANIELKIKNGADMKVIEKLTNQKSTYYSNIERADDSIPPSILLKVFSLTKKNNVTSIESGTGNYELIVLDSIQNGESDLSNKSLKTMFYNEQVNAVLYSVIQSLREQAKVKIYPKNL